MPNGLNYKTLTAIAILLLIVVFSVVKIRLNNLSPDVLGDEDEVSVSAFVRVTGMTFRVFPEKRIPRIGNWDTFVDLVLVNCENPNKTYTFLNIPTDELGYGYVPFSYNVFTLDNPYKVFIRGFSHLNREFNCYDIVHSIEHIDLTLEGKELLAGETSLVYDNYVNSLDMSVLIKDLFTAEYKTDLNQDGKVNSLDFANQIYNLFTAGN